MPPFSTKSTLPFLPTQHIVSSFFFKLTKSNLILHIQSWMGGLPLQWCQLTRDDILKENLTLPLSAATSCQSFSCRGQILCSSPLPKLGFFLALVCSGLVHTVTTTVPFYVTLSCYMDVQLRAECQQSLILCAFTNCESLY